MDAVQAGSNPEAVSELASLLVLVGVALGAGLVTERLLEPGVRARGFPLLMGLAGLYLGEWLFDGLAAPTGPILAGHPLAPAFVGALAVGGFAKLLALGADVPRW